MSVGSRSLLKGVLKYDSCWSVVGVGVQVVVAASKVSQLEYRSTLGCYCHTLYFSEFFFEYF